MKLTKVECSAIISAAVWKPVIVITQKEKFSKRIKKQLVEYIKANSSLRDKFDDRIYFNNRIYFNDILLDGYNKITVIDKSLDHYYLTIYFSGLILLYGFGNVLPYPDWIFAPHSEICGLYEYVKRNREVFR